MNPRIVEVRKNIMKKNDLAAAALRDRFRAKRMFVASLVSSPGAGKTAFLERTLTAARADAPQATRPRGRALKNRVNTPKVTARSPTTDTTRTDVPSGAPAASLSASASRPPLPEETDPVARSLGSAQILTLKPAHAGTFDAALRLEAMGRGGDLTGAAAATQALEQAVDRLRQALAEYARAAPQGQAAQR